MQKLIRQLRGVLVFSGLTVNTMIWFVPLLLLALLKLTLPVAAVRRVLTRTLMWIGEQWVAANTLLLSGSGSGAWRASGVDALRPDGWYLVLCNHQTWVDIVVLQQIFNRRVPFLKFFIKQELVWFPLLGIGFWALDMPFMKRYSPSYLARHPEKKGKDLIATRKACEKFRHAPTSVLNFAEGTRFSEAKRDRRASPYRRLMPPRTGGVAIALSSMGELFEAVLDVTLYYPDGPPSFWGMCCGDRVRVTAHVDALPLEEALLAGDYAEDRNFRKRVNQWVGEVWRRKDARLEELAGGQG
ncbi:MAG: acyltransferase [Pseudomonadota bacterium]